MATPWLDVARAEIGVHEIAGRQHNKRILEYHQATTLRATDDETPWCSAFANWCFQQVGITGTRSAQAISWGSWGVEVDEDDAREGDVVYFSWGGGKGHVGFVVGFTKTMVKVLGGNQDDMVCEKSFRKSSVAGYRRPRGIAKSNTIKAAAATGTAVLGKQAVDVANDSGFASTAKDLALEHGPKVIEKMTEGSEMPAPLMPRAKHPGLTGVSIILTIVVVGLVIFIAYERLSKGDLVNGWKGIWSRVAAKFA